MAFVGSPQRIQASVTICHYLHEEERSHPGRASGCEGRAPHLLLMNRSTDVYNLVRSATLLGFFIFIY